MLLRVGHKRDGANAMHPGLVLTQADVVGGRRQLGIRF